MSGVIESLERAQLRRVPVFQAGDRVRVHFQVVEGTRRRTQVFEGVVVKRQGNGARESTISKNSETRLVNCRLFHRWRCPGVFPRLPQYLPLAILRNPQRGSRGTLTMRYRCAAN